MMKRHKEPHNDSSLDSSSIIDLPEESSIDNPAYPGVQDDDSAGLRDELGALKSEVEKLTQQLQEKERELAELKDKSLRLQADFENSRRRIRQQSEESVRLQREEMMRDLLPIVDNLERAVDAARGGGNGQPIVQGVEMVLASMLDYLKRNGVTQHSAVGQPFDPAHHNAIEHVHSDTHPPNTVVQEYHKGYKIGDRTLRPAGVAVAKGADTSKRSGDEDADESS
jgi:molecular chaperone GrpE